MNRVIPANRVKRACMHACKTHVKTLLVATISIVYTKIYNYSRLQRVRRVVDGWPAVADW